MNPDRRSLEVLAALLRERSVTRAAQRLDMTQSAVSHTLARLRRLFNDPLFVPTGHGMLPTSRALELSAPLARVLGLLDGLSQTQQAFEPATFVGSFTIATSDYIAFLLLPDLIRQLTVLAPRLTLRIQPLVPAQDTTRLMNDELDLIIWNERQRPSGLCLRQLFTDRLLAVARVGHPHIEGSLTMQQFRTARHLCVSHQHGTLHEEIESIYAEGCKVALKVPHFLMAYHLVAQTDLLSMIAQRTAQRLNGSLPLQLLELPLKVPAYDVSMLWHPRREEEAAHHWLRNEIAAVAAALPALPSRR